MQELEMEQFLKVQSQKEELDWMCKEINLLEGEKLKAAQEVYKSSLGLPIEERLELLRNHLEGAQ